MSDRTTTTTIPSRSPEITRLRLIVLRGLYALIALGLGLFVWPSYVALLPEGPHFTVIALTMLAAFSILCVLGIRYPLQMLPVLLWELLWKSMWLLLVALPRWMEGTLDALSSQTVIDCLVGVVLVPLALPWSYVVANYLKRPAERWESAARPDAGGGGQAGAET